MVAERRTRSSYAGLAPTRAKFALIAVLLAINLCLILADGIKAWDVGTYVDQLTDADLYQHIAERTGSGESYYDAANDELGRSGYDRGALFHWRLPTYAWLFGFLAPRRSQVLLSSILLVAAALIGRIVRREAGLTMGLAATVAVLTASSGWLVYAAPVYFTELWIGVLLLLAQCLIVDRWRLGGLAVAGLALSLRELALPFCMFAGSIQGRNRRVVLSWVALIALFGLALILHQGQIRARSAATTPGGDLGWIAFGGPRFLLACCRTNFVLMALPAWVTAIYFPLALVGLYGWPSRSAPPFRGTVTIYLLLFSVVGKPFNDYWGWIFTPSLALGVIWAPLALRDLIAAARR